MNNLAQIPQIKNLNEEEIRLFYALLSASNNSPSLDLLEILLDYVSFISHMEKVTPVRDELHHILPRCLGGTDSLDNLIYLSYHDHYKAHEMLARTGVPKLVYAYWRMSNDGRITTPEEYESARRYFVECHSNFMKENNPMYNEEIRSKLSKSREGMKFSAKHRENLSKSHIGISNNWEGRRHTKESKMKQSESHRNVRHTEETKRKISEHSPDRKGVNNPMYGFKACWINDGLVNKRIPVEDLNKYPSWYKGRLPNKKSRERSVPIEA